MVVVVAAERRNLEVIVVVGSLEVAIIGSIVVVARTSVVSSKFVNIVVAAEGGTASEKLEEIVEMKNVVVVETFVANMHLIF